MTKNLAVARGNGTLLRIRTGTCGKALRFGQVLEDNIDCNGQDFRKSAFPQHGAGAESGHDAGKESALAPASAGISVSAVRQNVAGNAGYCSEKVQNRNFRERVLLASP